MIDWAHARLAWAPDVGRNGMRLTIEATIDERAGVILRRSLLAALEEIAVDGGVGDVEIQVIGDSIAIAADDLTERFPPKELRACLERLVHEAVSEGVEWARRDAEKASKYLDELALP